MLKRHENALNDLLEQVAFEGFAMVKKWQITRWYGQEKFSVGIRRDVRSRWEELSSELPWIKGESLEFAETKFKDRILLLNKGIFHDPSD